MRPVLSRLQSQQLDRYAIEQCEVPGLLLMENAGAGAARHIVSRWAPSRVFVLCGPGNNGGDGFVVARHLSCMGCSVSVALQGVQDALRDDAAVNARAWLGLGGEILSAMECSAAFMEAIDGADCVVDALFGTGLSRPLRGVSAKLIAALNESRTPVVSLDLPSGLDADTGEVLGVSVAADMTVTFAAPKLGLYSTAASRIVGELRTASLGVPDSLCEEVGASARLVDREAVGACLAGIMEPLHKGQAGRVLVVGGSAGMYGAAELAARAALRSGAGMVRVASFGGCGSEVVEALTTLIAEKDPIGGLEEELKWANAVILGPGLGQSDAARELARYLAVKARLPMVLDADALNLLSDQPSLLREAPAPRILTPHPAEAGRLIGVETAEVERNRFAALARLVECTGSTTILKGVYTLSGSPASEGGQRPIAAVNTSGTPALATAGSGDILSGLVGALLCHLSAPEAALVAPWIHGACAEEWTDRHGGGRGLLASELADLLPGVIAVHSARSLPSAHVDRSPIPAP